MGAVLVPAASPLAAQHVAGRTPDRNVPMPVVIDAKGAFQDKLARVGNDMYIAGQPTADGIRQLHDQGVTTVVNLRTPSEMARIGFDEAALVASLGMTYVYLPVRGDSLYPYSPATLDKLAAAMKDAKGGVLLHCTVAWRASHLWAAYLIRERGVPVDSALAQTRLINLMDDMRSTKGRQPVEEFLNRDISALARGRKM